MKQPLATKSEKLFSWIFLFLTLGIVAGIFWFNFNGRVFYNCDMYADAFVAKLMWTEKTLFPENWVFGNQFYIAATPTLAALMYGVLGDSFLALSSASCIMTIVVLISFIYCMKEAVEKKYIPLGMFCIVGACIICTGACSDFEGWQILYTMAGYYAFYLTGILLTMGVWLRFKKYNKVNPIMVIVVFVLNCALGMNSLRQTLISCLPLIGFEFLLCLSEMIKKKRCRSVISDNLKRIMYSTGVLISNIIGVILIKLINPNSAPIIEPVKLSYRPGEVFKNLIDTGADIASILGFSVYDEGLNKIPLLIAAAVFLLIVVVSIINILKEKEETPLTYLIAFSVISLACLVVTGVFLLRTRDLYYFVWYFLLTCCIIYLAGKLKRRLGIWFLVIVMVCGTTNCIYSFKNDFVKYQAIHSIYEKIAQELVDDGIEYIYAGVNFNFSVATYSKDKIIHSIVFWDFEKETGSFCYPVWYIQSSEAFEHTNDESAVFAISSNEWQKLEEKTSAEYVEEFSSCLELYKSFKGEGDEFLYFYYMTEDVISDFGVIANVENPHINQLY